MNERSIFMEALNFDEPREREAYILKACGGDERLRARIEALLRRHQADDELVLDRMPGVDLSVTDDLTEQVEEPNTSIGPYKLREQIGEGGMGIVYVAEQTQPVRRKVALKIIKPGMDTKQVISRFEAERQALAMMDHPNIAKVHDAGTTGSGRPYFVMELVRGIPITDYCDREKLSIPERLELFVPVCRAVQHAHQKGIIHRDLKPSNILVTVIDGAAVPKIIDFGVAKAMGQSLTERTIYTAFHQFVGTPLYMSPEQADLSGTDVDTRSDIYSLGVLLYELLSGTTPFDQDTFRTAAFDEMRRIIREQEPPKPSTRLSSLGATQATISANRKADPRRLARAVRGELDWIVMKALEKDRRRRYETANDFAADVVRYLTDQPVQACPPSARYRLGKFARKHRAALLAGAMVAMALVIGTVIATWQAIKATRAQSLAARLLVAEAEARSKAVAAERLAQENEKRAREQELLARRRYYASQINLAHQAAGAGQLARALRLVEEMRPRFDEVDLRTFEWYYLWKLCHPGRQSNWKTPGAAGAFSLDGRIIATGGDNIKLWDVASGNSRGVFQQTGVACLAFSPDGLTLAAGSWRHLESSPRLWDVPTGRGSPPLPGVQAHVRSIVFSHDGKMIVAGTQDGKVHFWGTAERELRRTFRPHTAPPLLAFSPDDALLVTSSWYGDARTKVWDLSGAEPRKILDEEGARCVAFSPDGRTIAVGDRLLDLSDTRRKSILPGHRGWLRSVGFSPDGKAVATACADSVVRLFDVATGKERLSHAHGSAVGWVAFSPDGKALATLSAGRLKLWDMAAGQNPTILAQPAAVRMLDFAKDGRSVLVAGDFLPRILDTTDGRELRVLSGSKESAALSPDWSTCASWTRDRAVKLSEARTGAALAILPVNQPKGWGSLAFSP
jgi:serine/threonine protein kinase/WD40 repeat protein